MSGGRQACAAAFLSDRPGVRQVDNLNGAVAAAATVPGPCASEPRPRRTAVPGAGSCPHGASGAATAYPQTPSDNPPSKFSQLLELSRAAGTYPDCASHDYDCCDALAF